MIRWSFLISRLVVIIAIVMLLRWGLGPVAKYITVLGLETATGAKVEISSVQVGLFPPSIAYHDFRVADPRKRKEMKDALRAESIEFSIDGEAMLHRRWVARHGKISGIEIGSLRETSGHYEQQEPSPPSASDEPSMLGRMLAATTDKLANEVDALTTDLETVRRSNEIRQQWEDEYETLVSRARNLEKQIRTVRDEARGIDNPLRDWPQLQRTLERARNARNELLAVRQAIDSLPDKLQNDLGSLDEARQQDLARLNRYVPDDLQGANEFGIDLMKQAVQSQLQKIQEYLDGGRTIASYTVVAPNAERVIGETIDLVGQQRRPSVLVRECEVSGKMQIRGHAYTLSGMIANLTPTPENLTEPTIAKLHLVGPEVVRVEYVQDRRRGADIDRLTLHWPQTEAKPLRLGNDHDAGLHIAGGKREIWVQLRSEGDQVQGRLVSKQTGLSMQLAVDSRIAKSAAVESLQSSLRNVDRIEIDANFEGKWSDLALSLHTNLGQVFHQATQNAINDQLAASKSKLKEKVNETHLQQTLALRQWLSSQQSEARALLASADQSIEEMSQRVMSEVGDADVYLGKLRGAIRKPLR